MQLHHPLLRQAYYLRVRAAKTNDCTKKICLLQQADDCEKTYMKDL